MPELLTIDAVTSGTSGSGTATLNCDLFQANPVLGNSQGGIQFPFLTKGRIFNQQITPAGVIVQFSIQFTHNATVVSPAFTTIATIGTTSSQSMTDFIDPRRPILMHSNTGQEGFQVIWTSGLTATVAHLTFNLELGAQEEEYEVR